MIKLDSIKKLMECAVISGYLKDEQPISLFLIGRPESGKSELIKVMRDFPNTFYTNDLSYKGCVDYVLPEVENNKISHILIPDFINIVSHKKAAATLVPLLNSLMSEGLKDLKIYGTKKEYRDPLFCGVITGITKEIFDKKIIYWRNIGFLTRMLVVTYGYTQLTKMAIHEYIRSGNYNNRIKPGADLTNIDKFRLRGLSVEIPKDIARAVQILSSNISEINGYYIVRRGTYNWRVDLRTYGFRLHKNLRSLIKAICLYRTNLEGNCVTEEDLITLEEFVKFMNFNFTEI